MSDDKIRRGKQAGLELTATEEARAKIRAALMEKMVALPIDEDVKRARLAIAVQVLDQLVTGLQSMVDTARIEESAQEIADEIGA